jgi:hypothetical protein
MPDRIQLSRRKGFRKPDTAVVVARPSKWGNPFTVAMAVEAEYEHPHRACVANYRMWIEGHEFYQDTYLEKGRSFDRRWVREHLQDLAGKDLACWCPLLDEHGDRFPCHADVLLKLAAAL